MTMPLRVAGRFAVLAISLILVFGAVNLQARDSNRMTDFQRFSLSLGGGFAFAESHQSMVDLISEFQIGLTPRLRIGIGAGYLTGLGGHGMGQGQRDSNGWTIGSQMDWGGYSGWGYEGQGQSRDFRIVPLSLNLYYFVPVGRRWDVFATGGASFYLGSFHGDSPMQHKNAWGVQAGLGVEYRLAQGLQLVAEGGYRFAEFHGLLNPPSQTQTAVENLLNIFEELGRRFNPSDSGAWQRFVNSFQSGTLGQPQENRRNFSSLNLNDFTFRLALKLGRGEPLGPASLEGYLPRGRRMNTKVDKPASERALDLLLARIRKQTFQTEVPLPKYEKIPPPPALSDPKSVRIALVSECGLVPKGNAGRLEWVRASKWLKYSIEGKDDLQKGDYEVIHSGYDASFALEDPDRLLPVDALRELVRQGEIGSLLGTYYITCGNHGILNQMAKYAKEIAGDLKAQDVGAVLLVAT